MYGKEFSEDHRQKISESLKGKNCGENNPMYGKAGEKHHFYGSKHTLESLQKMSESKKGLKLSPETIHKISGENNHMHGKTGENSPNARPEHAEARWFFFLSLSADMDIKEKRTQFIKAFPQIPKDTLSKWFRKWQRELERES